MLIVCPSCASTYSLTAEQLGSGRALRCAKCREVWTARPEDATPEASDLPVEAAIDRQAEMAALMSDQPGFSAQPEVNAFATAGSEPLAAPPHPPEPDLVAEPLAAPAAAPKTRSRMPVKKKPSFQFPAIGAPVWAGVALVALVAVGFTQRARVVRMLPQTAKLYAMAGSPVNLRGLEFTGVRSELVNDRGQTILVVEGEIRNVGSAPSADVPRLTLALRGAQGEELYVWTAEAPRSTLAKGERMPFRSRLVAPPTEGRDIVLRFASSESRMAQAH